MSSDQPSAFERWLSATLRFSTTIEDTLDAYRRAAANSVSFAAIVGPGLTNSGGALVVHTFGEEYYFLTLTPEQFAATGYGDRTLNTMSQSKPSAGVQLDTSVVAAELKSVRGELWDRLHVSQEIRGSIEFELPERFEGSLAVVATMLLAANCWSYTTTNYIEYADPFVEGLYRLSFAFRPLNVLQAGSTGLAVAFIRLGAVNGEAPEQMQRISDVEAVPIIFFK